MEKANFSYVITVASKNITQGGKTGGGEWIDVIRFRDWLQNDMQVRVANLFITNPKIPYTDKGIGLIQNQMIASPEVRRLLRGHRPPTSTTRTGTSSPASPPTSPCPPT